MIPTALARPSGPAPARGPSDSVRPGGGDPADATPARPPARGLGRILGVRLPVWTAGPTPVLMLAAAWLGLAANRPFLRLALHGQGPAAALAWVLALFALQWLLLALLTPRRLSRPVLALLMILSAAGAHFISRYGVVLDPAMLRNALRTDLGEARELLNPHLLGDLLLLAGPPLLLLARLRLRPVPLRRAVIGRLGTVLLAGLLLGASSWVIAPSLAALMRNHREARYLLTPANLLWSTGKVLAADVRAADRPREAVGTDARPGASWAGAVRPRVLLLVVGETARAANWGRQADGRHTTPALDALDLPALPAARACGTNTEVAVPCMFSAVGRRRYDEERIRRQDSLLHVLQRAGVAVHWRDNQSGCKGVCRDLPYETVAALDPPGLCHDGRCLDEGLFADLDARLAATTGTQVWVLHMLGNHGPAYHRRYPRAFARFQPECRDDDLHRCSPEALRNAYDNALLYTDHLLAGAIRRLQAHQDRVDSAFVYVSDHGESLGEYGLYLHGAPYAIAPAEQTRVPMVMWLSAGYPQAAGLAPDCLRRGLPAAARAAADPALGHDHLFHTVLGLLDVQTQARDPALDLTNGCRS